MNLLHEVVHLLRYRVVLELNVGASTFTFPSRLAITLQYSSTSGVVP